MTIVRDAELATVGPTFAVVHCTTDPDVEVRTRIGDTVVVTRGPYHVARVDGLEPGTEYELQVDAVEYDVHLPPVFQTLRPPPGAPRLVFATVNDLHYGEVAAGRWDSDPNIGPVFSSAPGEPPYAEMMNDAAIADMRAIDPAIVIAKGDLTNAGEPHEYERFRTRYTDAFGDRLLHVRGNHDHGLPGGVGAHERDGVTFAILDTTRPGHPGGAFPADQLEWLSDVARAAPGPVFVFGHHPPYSPDFDDARPTDPFCSTPADAAALAATLDGHDNIAGYFCGHTHRNRVRLTPGRSVPIVEVASVKEYPGAWAEYRVHDGGFVQMVHRSTAPEALAWSARTRHMVFGFYREYAIGTLADRCFVVHHRI